jgi:hypothetical protein
MKPDGIVQNKHGGIFYGKLWLKNGCCATDDDDDDDDEDKLLFIHAKRRSLRQKEEQQRHVIAISTVSYFVKLLFECRSENQLS